MIRDLLSLHSRVFFCWFRVCAQFGIIQHLVVFSCLRRRALSTTEHRPYTSREFIVENRMCLCAFFFGCRHFALKVVICHIGSVINKLCWILVRLYPVYDRCTFFFFFFPPSMAVSSSGRCCWKGCCAEYLPFFPGDVFVFLCLCVLFCVFFCVFFLWSFFCVFWGDPRSLSLVLC